MSVPECPFQDFQVDLIRFRKYFSVGDVICNDKENVQANHFNHSKLARFYIVFVKFKNKARFENTLLKYDNLLGSEDQ